MGSRSFRDPIHGFIPVSEPECQLLDTAPFRRLRNIRQLALTNLVYHGAEHSRFGHSLGVMHQATEVYDTVTKKGEIGWSNAERDSRKQLLRLAALCHDLGHAPFSHAGEEAALMPGRHEEYSVAIVRATDGTASEVRRVIEENQDGFLGISADEVADVIAGQALGVDSFLREIMSGELDADRTDYLQRDSLYCGVRYGRFDSERLVKTFTWLEDSGGNPLLAIEEDGVHAAEGLILARYFMFSQVYFHRVRRAYDHHLGEALRGVLDGGKYPDTDHLDAYLEWDDLRVFGELRRIARDGSQPGEHARRILERDHYRDAYHTTEHPGTAKLRRWDELSQRVGERFGSEVAFDSAEKAPHRFDKSVRGFPVVMDQDARPTSIEEQSALIDSLQELTVRRILAPKEKVPDIVAYCDSLNLNVR